LRRVFKEEIEAQPLDRSWRVVDLVVAFLSDLGDMYQPVQS
jgi:hypothetical protein